jgi:hypothetical protein
MGMLFRRITLPLSGRQELWAAKSESVEACTLEEGVRRIASQQCTPRTFVAAIAAPFAFAMYAVSLPYFSITAVR